VKVYPVPIAVVPINILYSVFVFNNTLIYSTDSYFRLLCVIEPVNGPVITNKFTSPINFIN